jgi:hypothetical protein
MASDILRTTVENHFNAIARRPMAYNRSQMYEIINAYHGTLPYWEPDVRIERFESQGPTGYQLVPLLYRPAIVNTIFQKIDSFLEEGRKKGLLVTGPQGIGKSFSLVNTVIALESTGDYLVTFIPDCDQWSLGFHLVKAIAQSIGVETTAIRDFPDFNQHWEGVVGEGNFKKLINAISNCLAALGKKWVFVFDQINKLFIKGAQRVNSISELGFPYNAIKNVMRPKQVISVISASANDEAAEEGQHDRFVEYYHPDVMDHEELAMAFPTLEDTRIPTRNAGVYPPLQKVIDLTAGVPFYAARFLNEFNGDGDLFVKKQMKEIKSNWDKLLETPTFSDRRKQQIVDNAILSYLMLPSISPHYDKKYFYERDSMIIPIIPIVSRAVREHFWTDLRKYFDEEEQKYVAMIRNPRTHARARGCLFENLVIVASLNPSRTPRLNLDDGTSVAFPIHFEFFQGSKLPELADVPKTYIPANENFRAVDFIWRFKDSVVGVQVHTTQDHRDVLNNFEEMCETAGWNVKYPDKLYLLYLCHDENVKWSVRNFEKTSEKALVKVFSHSIQEIDGFNASRWWS